MSITFHVRHHTCYQYGETVPLCHNEARVLPRSFEGQQINNEQLHITPAPDDLSERGDFFGNRVHYYSLQHPHDESSTLSTFEVTLFPEQRPDPAPSTTLWQDWAATLADPTQLDSKVLSARPWIYESPRIPLLAELGQYAREIFDGTPGLLEACKQFMAHIHHDFTFDAESTSVETSVTEAFSLRRGVCQDFTHTMIAGLRAIGVPARYVSGYLETIPPPGAPKLEGADATHAWVSVLDPMVGWVDFDPTNNLIPSNQHITIGWGRDFSDIIPLKGVMTGGEHHQLDVSVDVSRLA